MVDLAAGVFSSPALAWLVGTAGLAFAASSWRDRRRTRRQAAQLVTAQEKLADDLWEVKAAAEARERAEASTHAKSRFLATVSHEVRTPLNGILGMAELLGSTPLDAEQQAYLEAIHTSGRALATLIDEVLDLSRIEAGRLDLSSEPFELVALVEAVLELLAPRAQEKGLEIASFIAPELAGTRVGDPARLRQVLINLAGNAVKFTEQGGVGVRVEPGHGGAIRFTVLDSGPGVPPDRRHAIFDEFEQAATSTHRHAGGSGLGLSIARRLVRLMGGEITLADRDGGGSVFTFEASLPAAPDGALRADLPSLGGQVALIVARSVFQAPFLAQMLRAAGATVSVVGSVTEAVAQLETRGADLLLVDCALGEREIDALAAAPALRAVTRKLLLFSPFERRAFGQTMVQSFGGWLVKPVRARSIAQRLEPVADQASPPRPAPSVALAALGSSPASRPRILLAEDNEINTLVMLKMLDRMGMDVVHARDGAEALQAALATMVPGAPAFHTILMDINMPGLGGQEAARLIRRAEQREDVSPTRIVALTAYAFDEDRQACFDAGIDEFLTKPVDLARLTSVLQPAVTLSRTTGDTAPPMRRAG